jgi:membrane protease YdiL (CAAX protease family)
MNSADAPRKSGLRSGLLAASSILVVGFGYLTQLHLAAALLCLAACLLPVLYWVWEAGAGDVNRVFGFRGCGWSWLAGAILAGLAFAILLRWHEGSQLIPMGIKPFIIMAGLIGLTEELLFRGYFMGRFAQWLGPVVGVFLAAVLHTTYKVAIFIPTSSVDLVFLESLTLVVGLLLGWVRHASHSVWPCALFHIVFDLWVYGDRLTPWWVW